MQTEEVTYAGVRLGQKDQAVYAYESQGGSIKYWPKRFTGSVRIGSVIQLTSVEGEPTKIYTSGVNGPMFLRVIDQSDPKRVAWVLEETIAKNRLDSIRQANKEKREAPSDLGSLTLEQFRTRLRALSGTSAKKALYFSILEYLQ